MLDKKIQIISMTGLLGLILALSVSPVEAEQIRIAVIDSGAEQFADHTISFTSLPADEDPIHHGTTVTRLIHEGAPEAHITMLQICEFSDDQCIPSVEGTENALRWVLKNNIDIVNMSLVLPYSPVIETLIKKAVTKQGITFVAAAGHTFAGSRFLESRNGLIYRRTEPAPPSFPASLSEVLSVGSWSADHVIEDYSRAGCDRYEDGSAYGQEGTSFSAARVTADLARLHALETP